ncbi:MAG: hypothetical protein ACREBJ_04225 [Nitrosotalea sp.]
MEKKFVYEGSMNSDEIYIGEQQYMDYYGRKIKISMQRDHAIVIVKSKWPGSVEGNTSDGARLAQRITDLPNNSLVKA